MTVAEAYITPKLLTWARERCGFSVQDIARLLNVTDEKVQAWEKKEKYPTMRQARSFAQKTHIPFGYLYLDSPPDLPMPVVDFRARWARNHNTKNAEEEVNLYDLVKSILHKKEWYEDYLQRTRSNVHSDGFQASYTQNDRPHDIAKSISDRLNLHINDENKGRGKPATFWQNFKTKTIDAHIWLMQTGMVDSNTSRKILPTISRGLALKSPYYPVIWVNSGLQDAPKIFTLAHELAHIWIGAEGVSDLDEEAQSEHEIETLCDQVASEILVPEHLLENLWDKTQNPEHNVERLHEYFGVSRFVVARKSLHADIIDRASYAHLNQKLRDDVHNFEGEKMPAKEGGVNFYNGLIARNGRQFTEAVISETEGNNLLIRDACLLLGLNSPSTLDSLSKHLRGVK